MEHQTFTQRKILEMKFLFTLCFLSSLIFANSSRSAELIPCAGAMLDPEGYMIANPEAKELGADACYHYKTIGKKEGLNPNPRQVYLQNDEQIDWSTVKNLPVVVAQPGSLITCAGDLFDPAGYLSVNPDVKAAGVDACAHYTSNGKKEGRNPNPKNLSATGGIVPPPVNPPEDIPVTPVPTVTNYEKGFPSDASYQLDAPQSGYAPTKEIWTNLKIDVSSDYKLKLELDTRGWSCGPDDLKYKVESAESWMT